MKMYQKDKTKEIKMTSLQLEVLSRIVTLRKEMGYTQEMVAELLGCTKGQIGNNESEFQSHKYTLGHIYRLTQQFKYPIQNIFLGEGESWSTNQLIDAIVNYEEGIK